MIAILFVCLCFGSFTYAKPGVRPPRQATTCGQTFFPNKVSFSADGTPLKRIVGGIEATRNSIPWQVSLRFKDGGHFCGGSLVRVNDQDQSDIVVTAAHCITVYASSNGINLDILHNVTENDIDVFVGAHYSQSQTDGEKVAVGAIRKNPNWVYPTPQNPRAGFNNDIAILKLDKPVQFSNTIQPICLPSDQADNPADGSFGIVSGWGDLFEDASAGSDTLQQVVVPVVGSSDCRSVYRGLDQATTLCSGYSAGGKDSCQGDSGGPYFFKKPQGFVLYGVVSNGRGCARPGIPGLYTRISNYLGWISDKISELSAVQ